MHLPPDSRVAVVGAGLSGLVTARALLAEGWDVTVFERAADLGGVWSASRAYPGIATQDDRVSYAFSDTPMGRDVREHPTGPQVRRYLQAYADEAGVTPRIRFGTAVVRAALDGGDRWRIETDGPDGPSAGEYDFLVAANGTFSTPFVPDWAGREAFERAGGRVVRPGELGDGVVLDGRRVVVVGWGKTGCDVAVAAVGRATSVAVVARTLTWKYPKALGVGGLTYRHLVLTRLGQRLLWTGYRSASGRVLLRRLPERLPRQLVSRLLAAAVDRASRLRETGLRPGIAVGRSHSLVTDGFFEAVADGRLQVLRERSVAELGRDDDGPGARLSDGSWLPADVVVAATGYDQTLDFLDPGTVQPAAAGGSLALYRRALALDVPRFAVAGWMYNYHSPLTAEITAAWLAAVLSGRAALPSRAVQRRRADAHPLTRRTAAEGSAERLPGVTIGHLDAMLAELGAPLPLRTRLRQWWTPLDPASYAEALRLPTRRRVPADR